MTQTYEELQDMIAHVDDRVSTVIVQNAFYFGANERYLYY